MKILVQGAGLVGCTAALALARHGNQVTVVDLKPEIQESSGVLLYWNALRALKSIGMLSQILECGVPMKGCTKVYDQSSNELGVLNYRSLYSGVPTYLGIERMTLLRLVYNEALANGVDFRFVTTVSSLSFNENNLSASLVTADKIYPPEDFDVVVAADGVDSTLREYASAFGKIPVHTTDFGLWHAFIETESPVLDKNLCVAPGVRLGLVPLSSNTAHMWASRKEALDHRIDPVVPMSQQFQDRFDVFTGEIGNYVAKAISTNRIKYTRVREVRWPSHLKWRVGNLVFVGDAVHASTPFMAQGLAQGIEDAVSLASSLSHSAGTLQAKLDLYEANRRPAAEKVQLTSRLIGESYSNPTINLQTAQQSLDRFYNNPFYFCSYYA